MWQKLFLAAFLGLVGWTLGTQEVQQDSKILACYYGSWSVYRPSNGQFNVEDIDPNICTHLIYGTVGLTLDGVMQVLDPWNDLEENDGRGAMRRFTNLKQANPNLKTLLGFGGWNDCEPIGDGCAKYSNMASTLANRTRFINSVVTFLESYNFDGFELDWQYPTLRGGRPEDRANFALLCAEMRTEFDSRGWLLTAAVSAMEPIINAAYDIPSISQSLHYLSLTAYDMSEILQNYTHHHAPHGPIPEDSSYPDRYFLNVQHAVNLWLNGGCPAFKLALGMWTYGYGFILANEAESGFYAPTSSLIDSPPYTREPGIWGYNEIIEKQATEAGWRIVRNPLVIGPYAVQEGDGLVMMTPKVWANGLSTFSRRV
ncbi:probable chitinase 2 [Folsomia candida]|uniref:probable chitinase 2 n=1 Tax=Folsomia candida TaxID=158441 RepID=UPI001604B185|nr:probable chitinase 2 [Folsomia candida]